MFPADWAEFLAASAEIKSLTAEVAEDFAEIAEKNCGLGQTEPLAIIFPLDTLWRSFCRLDAGGRAFQAVDGFPGIFGLRAMRQDFEIAFEFRDRFVGAIHFFEADG